MPRLKKKHVPGSLKQLRCVFVQVRQIVPCGVSARGWFMWLVDKVHTSSVIGRSGNCEGVMWFGWQGWGMRWHRARQSNQWDLDMWACFTCTHKTCRWECSKEKQKKQLVFYFGGKNLIILLIHFNITLTERLKRFQNIRLPKHMCFLWGYCEIHIILKSGCILYFSYCQ